MILKKLPLLFVILSIFFALPLFIDHGKPFCPLNYANAQDNPCLAQESTIVAQELQILRLESTISAYEQNRTAYLANIIGLWASTEGQYVKSWYFRNGGSVDVVSQESTQTGTYTLLGDNLTVFLIGDSALFPSTYSFKIVDVTDHELVLEVVGENRTIGLVRSDEFALTATQSAIPTSTSTPTRTPEPTWTPRPTLTPSLIPTITPATNPEILETVDRLLNNWGGYLVEEYEDITVDTSSGLVMQNLSNVSVRMFVLSADIMLSPGASSASCGFYFLKDEGNWYGASIRQDGALLETEWIYGEVNANPIRTDAIDMESNAINRLIIIGLSDRLVLLVNDEHVSDFEPLLSMSRGRLQIIATSNKENGETYCRISNAWLWDLDGN